MPIIQRIEISNILNLRREEPWKASWPYEIFEIRDRNAAINIPNGCGKSTIMKTILAMLVGEKKMLKELRTVHYAPRSTGLFSHVRIQVKINSEGPVNDLVSSSGGDLPGEPMVFGIYGNSGENEDVHLYSYKGTFEDCPIGHHEGSKRILVRDDVFLKNLSGSTRLFPSPSNKSESTNSEWKRYISDIFDMPSLLQQLNYQAANGGEGGGSYFDITEERGSNFSTKNYSAKVFYKILAPELLVNVMGDQGEVDETSIEDTILIKVSQLLTEKRKSDQHKKTLEMTENTLNKLEESLKYADDLIKAKATYAEHASDFMTEMAAVKSVVIDNPIPGIPQLPPESINPLARMMVLQNGEWYIPDRVMAEFTNESSSDVNKRASDRNHIQLIPAQNTQVIDFTCHSFFTGNKRGPSGKLYTREAATSLLNKTNNFTREWTLDKAITAVNESFDWVEAHSDTNPARILIKQNANQLKEKETRQGELLNKAKKHSEEKIALLTKQQKISTAQFEYKKIVESNLFFKAELESLSKTGLAVTEALKNSDEEYQSHIRKVSSLDNVFKDYNNFIEQYGQTSKPKEIAEEISANLKSATSNKDRLYNQLKDERTKRPSLQTAYEQANKLHKTANENLEEFLKIKPLLVLFNEIFGDVSAKGLEHDVITKLKEANKDISDNNLKISSLKSRMDGLNKFRAAYPDQDPQNWLESNLAKWTDLGSEIKDSAENLKDKKSRRSDLDKDAVAPSKLSREVMEMAGDNAIAMHVAIEKMNLSLAIKQKVLTLFSAMLHTPVYNSVDEAAHAAKLFFENEIESPVFVFHELKEFCHSETIMLRETIANTWLVGVRTRPVDCILNPDLVDKEKAILDEEIKQLESEIEIKSMEREKYNQNSNEVAIARVAKSAIDDGIESQYESANAALLKIQSSINELERRASAKAIEAIKAKSVYEDKFINTDENALTADNESKLKLMQNAKLNLEGFDTDIDNLDAEKAKSDALWEKAVSDSRIIPKLEEIQKFLDEPGNLVRMQDSDTIKANLLSNLEHNRKKSNFDFNLAEEFLSSDVDGKNIESQLTHLSGEIENIEKKLLPEIKSEIEELR